MGQRRAAGVGFILVTLLINVLGIGLIIPVLPKLVAQLAGTSSAPPTTQTASIDTAVTSTRTAQVAPEGGVPIAPEGGIRTSGGIRYKREHSPTTRHATTQSSTQTASGDRALPPHRESLSTSAFTYGTFVAIYATMQFLFAPLLGALSDRFGRRPVLLVSTLGTSADYLLMTFAPTLPLLFIGRMISGITGASITTCNAYIADITPPEDRAKRFGMLGAVFGIGFVVGPFVGGLLGEWHLRAPFAFSAALAFINFLYGLLVLPESHPKENRSAFKLAKANPLGSLRVLREFSGVIPLATALTLANLAQFALHATWVLYTGYRFGWGPRDVGMSLGFVGVLAVVVQGFLTGKVVKRIGERRTLVLALVFATTAFVLYGLAPVGWMMYPAMVVGALGGLAGPAVQSMITREVGAKNQGLAQGALSSLGALAAVFAPLAATLLFGSFSGPQAIAEIPGISFLMGASFLAISLVIAIVYHRAEANASANERVTEEPAASTEAPQAK